MSRCVLCDRSVPHVCDYSDVGHEPEDIIASLRDEVERLRAENTWLKTSDEAIPFARRTIDGQRAAKAKEAAGTLMAEMLTERSHRVAATRRAEQLTALARELADVLASSPHFTAESPGDWEEQASAALARVKEVLGEEKKVGGATFKSHIPKRICPHDEVVRESGGWRCADCGLEHYPPEPK